MCNSVGGNIILITVAETRLKTRGRRQQKALKAKSTNYSPRSISRLIRLNSNRSVGALVLIKHFREAKSVDQSFTSLQ